jgi:hypothetical protein
MFSSVVIYRGVYVDCEGKVVNQENHRGCRAMGYDVFRCLCRYRLSMPEQLPVPGKRGIVLPPELQL